MSVVFNLCAILKLVLSGVYFSVAEVTYGGHCCSLYRGPDVAKDERVAMDVVHYKAV